MDKFPAGERPQDDLSRLVEHAVLRMAADRLVRQPREFYHVRRDGPPEFVVCMRWTDYMVNGGRTMEEQSAIRLTGGFRVVAHGEEVEVRFGQDGHGNTVLWWKA